MISKLLIIVPLLIYPFQIFSQRRPVLKKDDISNFDKVSKYVEWFIRNEPLVDALSNRSSNIIFDEGYIPTLGLQNDPKSYKQVIGNLSEWFIIKVFLDLNMLKDFPKHSFEQFIDYLDEAGIKTITTAGKIADKYDLNMEKFIYDREIEKIPRGTERETFKKNFLNDNVLGAEIRILAWLYHEYFGEWYQIKKNKNT